MGRIIEHDDEIIDGQSERTPFDLAEESKTLQSIAQIPKSLTKNSKSKPKNPSGISHQPPIKQDNSVFSLRKQSNDAVLLNKLKKPLNV